MASDGEREDLGLTLTTNAAMVAAVLRGAEDPATQSVMAAIAATRTSTWSWTTSCTPSSAAPATRAAPGPRSEACSTSAARPPFSGSAADRTQTRETNRCSRLARRRPQGDPHPRARARAALGRALGHVDKRVTELATVEVFESTLATVSSTYGEFVAFGTPTSQGHGRLHGRRRADGPRARRRHRQGVLNADEQVAGSACCPPTR